MSYSITIPEHPHVDHQATVDRQFDNILLGMDEAHVQHTNHVREHIKGLISCGAVGFGLISGSVNGHVDSAGYGQVSISLSGHPVTPPEPDEESESAPTE